MVTNSYFEYVMTILGWTINNGIWATLSETGIIIIPFIFSILATIKKAWEQGEDEGNKALLTINWIESYALVAFLIIFATLIPSIKNDTRTVTFDIDSSKKCGVSTLAPQNSGYQPLVNELSGKTSYVPVWWYLVHSLSKGVLFSALATLPCQPDLRQTKYAVQNTKIDDPLLLKEIQDFAYMCFGASRHAFRHQYNSGKIQLGTLDELKKVTQHDIDWLGSRYFLSTPGFYDTYYSETPRKNWPYDPKRDATLYNNGQGGYPTCKQWWLDRDIGIKDRVLALLDKGTINRVKSIAMNKADYEEGLLRQLVRPENRVQLQGGRVFMGYGGSANTSLAGIPQTISRLTSSAGTAIGNLVMAPAFDAMRQALPMVQALLMFALIVCMPFVIVFSAYSPKAVITLTFVQFGLIFLTFWWEFARWLDSWLIQMIYDSATHEGGLEMWLQNSSDDLILNLVLGSMFLVLPAFFISSFTWAGVRLGDALSNSMRLGTDPAKASGGEVANTIKSKTIK